MEVGAGFAVETLAMFLLMLASSKEEGVPTVPVRPSKTKVVPDGVTV